MITTELRDKTRALLINRPVWKTLKNIEDATGIPEGWLKRFARGVVDDPGVNRIETLYNHLSEDKLKV